MKSSTKSNFDIDGFLILNCIGIRSELNTIEASLSKLHLGGAGTRNLLRESWCRRVSEILKQDLNLKQLLPLDYVAVQCTYFEKSENDNWLVALHRDFFIPVKNKVPSKEWSRWSEKEGLLFVRPPDAVLQNLVAVRVHLEDNTEANSPLQVVPGSHLSDIDLRHRVCCLVPRGGALVMRPLILHASSKLIAGTRRVLHFVYGPKLLPNDAEWG
jgi:hypothetical protein